MKIIELCFVFALGLCLGSFYTALASRILYYYYGRGRKEKNRWKHILGRSSFCFSCKRNIPWKDLIPILSYVMNRGQCKKCSQAIGIWTFLGESYLGLLTLVLYYYSYSWPMILFSLVFCGHLYISLATDSRFFIIDPENTIFLFLWSFAFLLAKHGLTLGNLQLPLLAFAISFLFFFILFLFSRQKGLGLGDVLLICPLALYASLPWILVIIIVGATASILYILLWQRDLRKPAPLGACLILSTLVIILSKDFFYTNYEIYR